MKAEAIAAAMAMMIGWVTAARATVNIETVPVGNSGNAADTRYETPGYGAVDYVYNIARYEVTAGQYTEFLNAVAATDTYELYHTWMALELHNYQQGCKIQRSGSSGSYSYSVAPDWANRPVNLVDWGDAARFANWLHNGQPTGAEDLTTTEDGAYFLNGATSDAELLAVTREADWKWAIPTEDEWYKAAYYDGEGGLYYDYPTGTDTRPSNELVDPDPGNNATFYIGGLGFTIGSPYYRTEVGAHENSESPYGTYDQAGNVFEWTEAVIGSDRGLRGGAYFSGNLLISEYRLHAAHRSTAEPSIIWYLYGFRVYEVPEPATLSVLALGGLAFLRRRKR